MLSQQSTYPFQSLHTRRTPAIPSCVDSSWMRRPRRAALDRRGVFAFKGAAMGMHWPARRFIIRWRGVVASHPCLSSHKGTK